MESSRNKILKSNNFYFTVIMLKSKNKTEGQNDEMDGRSRLLNRNYSVIIATLQIISYALGI